MKQPDYLKEFFLLALLLLPMAYLAIIWNQLPVTVPAGNPPDTADYVDRRNDFLLLMIFLFVTNGLLYALFRYLPNTGEVQEDSSKADVREYFRIRFIIHIYLAVFSCIIIFMFSQAKPFAMERWAFAGVGALITGIGFYLRKLAPNHYVGVRTPWTLQSSEIWTETHHMAGTLWICTGLAIIISGFFLSLLTGVFLIFFAALVLAALPYIYSFRLYNKDKG
ncbi:SdpI family protein [Chitinophaga solisilvae]|uniref:SdpI family protein n=1 Tax=Chitinophaga solisilvae TaxID=1233460 RepID=UPI001368EC27|nr:SdpI family protein [Chitinophaga solisilvae]